MTAIIELYANNAYSSLAATLSSSATTMSLSTGTGTRFPNPTPGTQFFRLTITSQSSPNTIYEIVYVTQRSTDTLTILRGQEGSTAQSWAIGDLCGLEPTAGMMGQFLQPYYGTDTGATNAYVVSTANASTTYYSGMPVAFITLNANTSGTPTLNLNGLGARTITNNDGSSLLSGQIPANAVVQCNYNAGLSRWELQSMNGVGITPSFGDSTTKYATTAFVQNALGSYISSGTKVLFYQASAPTGWTQLTTVSDAAIRIVSGTGGGATGGNNFSTTFVAQAVSGTVSISGITGTVGGTALTSAQLPAHNHAVTDPGHSHGVNDPGHLHLQTGWTWPPAGGSDFFYGQGGGFYHSAVNTNASQTGIYLSAATTGISTQNTGSGGTHTHSLTINPASGSFTGTAIPMNVKYIDVIICSKN